MSVVKMTEMMPGQQGTIYKMPEDREARVRLEQMGLRCGMMVGIRNKLPLRGPVLIMAGRTEVAIGNELASNIEMQVTEKAHGMGRRHRWGARRRQR